MVKELLPLRERMGMRRSDIMLVNIAVWVNCEKNLRSNVSMWANYYTRHKQQLPFVIWRDASVQHFNTPTGLHNTHAFRAALLTSPFVASETKQGRACSLCLHSCPGLVMRSQQPSVRAGSLAARVGSL